MEQTTNQTPTPVYVEGQTGQESTRLIVLLSILIIVLLAAAAWFMFAGPNSSRVDSANNSVGYRDVSSATIATTTGDDAGVSTDLETVTDVQTEPDLEQIDSEF